MLSCSKGKGNGLIADMTVNYAKVELATILTIASELGSWDV